MALAPDPYDQPVPYDAALPYDANVDALFCALRLLLAGPSAPTRAQVHQAFATANIPLR